MPLKKIKGLHKDYETYNSIDKAEKCKPCETEHTKHCTGRCPTCGAHCGGIKNHTDPCQCPDHGPDPYDYPPFPPQAIVDTQTMPILGKSEISMNYIGTWKIYTAKDIARRIRKDGFTVNVRPRGKGRFKNGRLNETLKAATFGAVYIRAKVYDIRDFAAENGRMTGFLECI